MKLYPSIFNREYYPFFLILLLIATSSQVFLIQFKDEVIIGVAAILALLMFFKKKFPSPKFVLMLGFLFAWLLLIYAQNDVWNTRTFVGFFLRLFIAYAVVALLRFNFYPAFVETVYKLSIFSLLMFLAGVVLPSSMQLLHNLLASISNVFIVDFGEYSGWLRANFLIYTFSVVRLEQNHGFMWEPTAFAAVVLLAMLVHLSLNQFKLDRKFMVLLVTLLSTFSTTAFIALPIIAVFYLMNSKNASQRVRQYRLLLGVYALFILVLVLPQLDFVTDKVAGEFSKMTDVTVATDYTMLGNTRLSSFIFDFMDWTDHPLLGLGIYEENRYQGRQEMGSVNGVGDTLVRFGLIVSLLFLYNLSSSFKLFCKENGVKGYGFFVLIILIFSWSERLTLLPLFLAFQFYVYVHTTKRVGHAK